MKKNLSFFNFKKLDQKGFSLIESAIAVLVLSTISISITSLFKVTRATYENQKIQSHELLVKNALQIFYKNNERMPYPSPDNSGVEINDKAQLKGDDILVGYIPYKTLGITHDEASDAKGNIMTYVVHKYDCLAIEKSEFDGTSTIDTSSLKNLFAKSKLMLSSNGNDTEIYFAIMPRNLKLQRSGANTIIAKNGKTFAMSKNAFLNETK